MEPAKSDTSRDMEDCSSACSAQVKAASPSMQDSGIGMDDKSLRVSYGYYSLFGRKYRDWDYATANCDRYFCAIDEMDLNALNLQNEAIITLMHDELHLAPLSTTPHSQMLDVCTGTGNWAVDIADKYPDLTVNGVDWAPVQPYWVPHNLYFDTEDMRRPWEFGRSYDYIHTRATIYMGCWEDFKKDVVEQAFDNLYPGGWFESQEIGHLVMCDDGTLPADAPLATWARHLNTAAASQRRPRDVAGQMLEWYKEVGFVDVQQHVFKMPIGTWAADPRLRRAGALWLLSLRERLEGLSQRIFNETFGWELAHITRLLGCVRQNLKNPTIHAYTEFYVVFGRKPMQDELVPLSTSPPRTVNESDLIAASSDRMTPWSPTPELLHSSSTDCSGDDSLDEANNSNTSGLASISLADDESSNSSLFRHRRRDLINHLIDRLCRYLDSKVAEAQTRRAQSVDPNGHRQFAEASHTQTDQAAASQGSSVSMRGATSAHGAIAKPSRRSAPPSFDGEGEDDEDGDNRRRKRSRPTPSDEVKKLACPYYKRNPQRYGRWTSCPGPGWDEVHRVKAHLYKRHALPLQCPRCWESFRAEGSYREHLQKDPPCAVLASQKLVDGFTKEQEKMLRSRRKARPDMNRVEKWNEVYTILFPDDNSDSIPSPYYENTDDEVRGGPEDYAMILRREMPGLVRRQLDVMFQTELQDLEVALRPRIEQIMTDVQSGLLRMFQASDGESNMEPGAPEAQQDHQDPTSSGTNLQDGYFEAEQGSNLNYPDDIEGDWDRDPSVSYSAATLFSDTFFDISFEKMLDPAFVCVETGSLAPGESNPET